MDLLIGTMLMFGLPVYLALQLWTAIRWTGGWRTAALAPLLLMVPVALHAAVALMAQSNLWPLLVNPDVADRCALSARPCRPAQVRKLRNAG
jgi:hypothetical protein